MKDLIKALQILEKYASDTYSPTHCEHDELWITCVNPYDVSAVDAAELKLLGFIIVDGGFRSFRFGSS